MRPVLTILLAAALAAPTSSAHADEAAAVDAVASPAPTWELRTWYASRSLAARSATVLTTDAMVGWGISVERRLATVPLPGPFRALDVTAELGHERAGADGTTFDQLDNEFGGWAFTAGARARLPILSWLHAGARATLGAGKSHVRIADSRMPEIAIEDGGGIVTASGGVSLALLPRMSRRTSAPFFMGLEVELGYHLESATTVHAYPEDRPEPELTIPAHYATLGDVSLRGATVRVAATIGF